MKIAVSMSHYSLELAKEMSKSMVEITMQEKSKSKNSLHELSNVSGEIPIVIKYMMFKTVLLLSLAHYAMNTFR